MTRSIELRSNLADELERTGDLRTPAWRDAVERVPREAFLGDRIYSRRDEAVGTWWVPTSRHGVTAEDWLELVYQNETWVTQVEGKDQAGNEPLTGSPSSSSTLPGLVVMMLEAADIKDGHNVLEIGTGTGYSTALLCERLGDDRVVSVEVDPHVAGRAAASLDAAGYHPTLVVGDGLSGHGQGAPYDRVVATCSVRAVPRAWLAQTGRGGKILTTLSGWLYGSGLVLLDVDGPEHATGRFLPGTISFMTARAHAAPDITEWPPPRDGETRAVIEGREILDDWMGRFLAQLAAPNASTLGIFEDEDLPPTELLVDHATGSYAWLAPTRNGAWTVTQAGALRLWDDIERTFAAWREAGEPPQQDFAVTITPEQRIVRLRNGELSWNLPAEVIRP